MLPIVRAGLDDLGAPDPPITAVTVAVVMVNHGPWARVGLPLRRFWG
jgi:hypothetical protein